jgi:hypothetical protein
VIRPVDCFWRFSIRGSCDDGAVAAGALDRMIESRGSLEHNISCGPSGEAGPIGTSTYAVGPSSESRSGRGPADRKPPFVAVEMNTL